MQQKLFFEILNKFFVKFTDSLLLTMERTKKDNASTTKLMSVKSAKSGEQQQKTAEEKRMQLIRDELSKFLNAEMQQKNSNVHGEAPDCVSLTRPTLRADDRCQTYVEGVSPKPGDYLKVGDVVQNRYKILCKLREGGFGQIYSVWDEKQKDEFAMKVEPVEEGQPNMEAYVLWKFSLCNHCPKLYGAGRVQEGKYNFVVMQLLGRNLTELRRQCRLQPPRMSLSTVLRLVFQAIRAIETLHNIGFLHRDVKPSNFAMGSRKNDERTLYILDFGLARYFMTKDGKLRSSRAQCGFRGTVRYASTNAHDLVDLSRRDDLWSLFYAYFELLIGELPWSNTADRQKTGEEKRRNTPESLCRWIPKETTVFVRLVRRLRYEDRPQYDAIVSALLVCMKRFSIAMDDPMDWQVADCKALRHWTVAADCPDK